MIQPSYIMMKQDNNPWDSYYTADTFNIDTFKQTINNS